MNRYWPLVFLSLLVAVTAYAAIDTANKRFNFEGVMPVPDAAVDAADRLQMLNHVMNPLGTLMVYRGFSDDAGGGVSTGTTSAGGGIHILKRKRRYY